MKNNMKNLYKGTMMLALTFMLGACNLGEFDDDITTNPNAVTKPYTGNLLTNVIAGFPSVVNDVQRLLYVQQIANSQYADADRYGNRQFDFGGLYAGPLADLKRVMLVNTNPDLKAGALQFGLNENQIALAQILEAYIYLHMTDRWGPVPFSESLGGLEGSTVLPKYESQEAIYNALFTQLATAVNSFVGTTDGALGKSDILFGGNLTRWKQFANTTRMNMALRISEVNPAKGQTEYNAALNASGGVIAEDVVFEHLANINWENPWFSRFRSRRDQCIANTLVFHMQPTSYVDPVTGDQGVLDVAMDPRLPIFADPIEVSLGGTPVYNGIPYGWNNSADFTGGNTYVSFYGSSLRTQTQPSYIYTMAQIHFSRAEAALLGWDTNPQTHYEAGITSSMDQYGVDAADAATYMTNAWVAYDATKAEQQILTQKWIANFGNGFEAWADWRRTGYPVLVPAKDPLNTVEGGAIPVRDMYGTNTQDLNTANYESAVSSLLGGPDLLNTPLWWDK
jgi:hypothetical protein